MSDGDTGTATLTIRFDPSTERLVVGLSGEIDVATAPMVMTALETIEASETRVVAIDLDEVTFIDSSGLRVLLIGQRILAERGLELVVCNAQPQASRLFAMTASDRVLGIPPKDDA
jgi:anti-sigma B factor antagonist